MKAVVVANGEIQNEGLLLSEIGHDSMIVCANGGTANALALGLSPHVVIGDLDSISPTLRCNLEAKGTEFIVYPSRKDETDTELALRYCVERGAESILFVGALGGRLDHTLANLSLLAERAWRSIPVRILDGHATVELCSGRCDINGSVGDIVSLLPCGGDVIGVHTEGLEYPLDDETLFFGPARGISNVMSSNRATIAVRDGLLLVIHYRRSL